MVISSDVTWGDDLIGKPQWINAKWNCGDCLGGIGLVGLVGGVNQVVQLDGNKDNM